MIIVVSELTWDRARMQGSVIPRNRSVAMYCFVAARKTIRMRDFMPHLYNSGERSGKGNSANKLICDSGESFLCEFFCAGLAGQDEVGPFGANLGQAHGFAGQRFWAAGIVAAEIDAVHGMGCDDAISCVLARGRHEHGMAAAIDADFYGVDVEFGEDFLKVGQDAGSERLATGLVE